MTGGMAILITCSTCRHYHPVETHKGWCTRLGTVFKDHKCEDWQASKKGHRRIVPHDTNKSKEQNKMTCKYCIHCIAWDPDGNVYCDVTEGWGTDISDEIMCRGYEPIPGKEEEK